MQTPALPIADNTAGGPGTSTMPYGSLVHCISFRYFDVGNAAATSVVLLVLGAVFALLYLPLVRPLRRVHIPTAQGQTRPIGIAACADKGVQDAEREVLEAIDEQDVLDCS